jgi:hypothetical protein
LLLQVEEGEIVTKRGTARKMIEIAAAIAVRGAATHDARRVGRQLFVPGVAVRGESH